ncbi:unannotated protein [freshwater metagenome]|uniref:Unannotated protein n=1 Tax=freshwater metagenome TaxID=449393 RepID=A0A6J5YR12_9ZZZZ|nr:hypothetical protein [Actinomycetota bacterium]
MRISRVAVIATALLVSPLIAISSAAADSKTPAPTNQNIVDSKAAYKIALDQYRKDLKTYEDLRREINKIYKEAIEKALADARSARSVDQTQKQMRQTMKAQQNAVIAATIARDAAIEALGKPPFAPAQPGKAPSGAKAKTSPTQTPPTVKKK